MRIMGDRVAAAPLDGAELVQKENELIVITDAAAGTIARDKEFRLGTIIAVGPGLKLDTGKYMPLPVNKGDVIVWRKFEGVETVVDGQDITILEMGQVLGVIEQ